MKKITQSEFDSKVEAHRLWREDRTKGQRLVLNGADLRYCSFQDCEMRGVDFQDCDFRGSDFQDCNFRDCNLIDCNFRDCSLVDANMPAPTAPSAAAPIATPQGPKTRRGILDTARSHVSNDREATYGSPEDNFAIIAGYWSIHLGHPVSSTDVALMMGLLKVARLRTTPTSLDGWVDLAGYAACGGEIAMKGEPDA